MKSAAKKKSRRRSSNNLRYAKRDRKNQALEPNAICKVDGVNRENTLANWVAGMKSMANRGSHRGATTLASWIRAAS
jgi:hypothetical protein